MNKKRQLIWDKSKGKCWYCGSELSDKWDADHFHPVIRDPQTKKMLCPEFDVIENLVPSCKPCNNFKHSNTIDGFRFSINEQFDNVPKSSTGMRQLMRMSLVEIERKPVVFWYEKQDIKMPTTSELLGISKEAQSIEWKQDKSEYQSFYYEFEDGICTLRHVGGYYLAIYMEWGREEKGRERFENSRLSIVKSKAAQWAISLTVTNLTE